MMVGWTVAATIVMALLCARFVPPTQRKDR